MTASRKTITGGNGVRAFSLITFEPRSVVFLKALWKSAKPGNPLLIFKKNLPGKLASYFLEIDKRQGFQLSSKAQRGWAMPLKIKDEMPANITVAGLALQEGVGAVLQLTALLLSNY